MLLTPGSQAELGLWKVLLLALHINLSRSLLPPSCICVGDPESRLLGLIAFWARQELVLGSLSAEWLLLLNLS